MPKLRRLLLALLLCSTLFTLFPATAHAWGRNWLAEFICHVSPAYIPEGTVYIDMLVPIGPEDERYCAYNEENGARYGIGPDSEIVSLARSGLRSYTFHDSQAHSDMDLGDNPHYIDVRFFSPSESWEAFYQDCRRYRSVRMAYLDEDGRILRISEEAPIYNEGMDKLRVEHCCFKLDGHLHGDVLSTELWWDQRTLFVRVVGTMILAVILFFEIGSPWSFVIFVSVSVVVIAQAREKKKQRREQDTKLDAS